jgi:hypothetical protein
VEVWRTAKDIRLEFTGESARQLFVVPTELLGSSDPEQEELDLLAKLKRMGYRTGRRSRQP